MPGFPPGEYSPMILSGLWPMNGPEHPMANQALSKAHCEYHRSCGDKHRMIRSSIFASELGQAADLIREALADVEERHHKVADGHEVKAQAYGRAQSVYAQLISDLSQIAADADSKIKQIQQSKKPAATKLAEITEIVSSARTYATHKVASATNTIGSSAESVLSKTGQDRSLNDVIKSLGNKHSVEMPSSTPDMGKNGLPSDIGKNHAPASEMGNNGLAANGGSTSGLKSDHAEMGGGTLGTKAGAGIGQSVPTAPAPQVVAPHVSAPQAPSLPAALNPASAASSLSPANLAKGVSTGMSTGFPASMQSNSAANAVVSAASHNPATGVQPPPVVTAPAAPASVPQSTPHVTSIPAVQDVSAPVQAHSPQVASAGPYVAAAPVAQPVTQAAPSAPPMTAYGSDIRVPQTSVPTAPASPAAPVPTGGAASTAPVGAGLGQPAVVRATPPPSPSPGAMAVGQTVAATTGAATGAAVVQASNQQRCENFLNSVARQESQLRWAVGADGDGLALVLTDLAGGWVPPHVRTPRGTRLPSPSVDAITRGVDPREGVRDREFSAAYAPGEWINDAGASDVELADVRQAAPLETLAWDLRQATERREGLPRLAHTLAKAWAGQTGVLDSELSALSKQLDEVRAEVLHGYRTGTDLHLVGNWMLLSSIDAAINGTRSAATYHLRWYQAVQEAVSAAAAR